MVLNLRRRSLNIVEMSDEETFSEIGIGFNMFVCLFVCLFVSEIVYSVSSGIRLRHGPEFH